MHLTCTNMPVEMVDKALKVRVFPPPETASPETPFCRLADLFSSALIRTSSPAVSPSSRILRFDTCRKPTTLDAATFWHCVVTRLAVSKSGSRLRAGSITRSTSSSTSASTTATTFASVYVLSLTTTGPVIRELNL